MEAMSNMKGQTLLYVPGDDINDPQSALKDKVSSSGGLYKLSMQMQLVIALPQELSLLLAAFL